MPWCRIAIATAFAFVVAASARGAEDFPMSYAGRLTTAIGQPAQGKVDLTFTFFDVKTGGSQLVAPIDVEDVSLIDGMFQVELVVPRNERNFIFVKDKEVWIEVKDRTNKRTYPRQRYFVAPLALRVPIDGTTITWNDDGELQVGAGSALTGVTAGTGLTGGGAGGNVTLSLDYATIPGLDNSGNAVVTSLDVGVLTGTLDAARLPTATGSTAGKLTSTDWTTFNNKEPALSQGLTTDYYKGNKTWAPLDTDAVAEATKKYFTNQRARDAAVSNSLTPGVEDVAPSQDAVVDALALKQDASEKGQPFGYAALDSNGNIDPNDLPYSGLVYKGAWNATSNSPTLPTLASCGTPGDYYIVNTPGSTNLDGITSWNTGDWVICGATNAWQRVGSTAAGVQSVNGDTNAAVVLTTGNINEGGGNQYFTNARARSALSATAPLSYNSGTGIISLPAPGTSAAYIKGDLSIGTFLTDVRGAFSGSAPLSYNSGTGALSIPAANGSTNGYLSSGDWTTFNGKQNAVTTGSTAQYFKGDFSLGTFNTDVAAAPAVVANTAKVSSQWTTNGANVHFSSGNVGIGSSSPAAALDVAGKIHATEICDEGGAHCKDISGGWSATPATPLVKKSSNYTVTTGDAATTFIVSGASTLTLPAANAVAAGFTVAFKRDDAANASLIAPAGSDTIDGFNAALEIYRNRGSTTLVSDGTSQWYQMTPVNVKDRFNASYSTFSTTYFSTKTDTDGVVTLAANAAFSSPANPHWGGNMYLKPAFRTFKKGQYAEFTFTVTGSSHYSSAAGPYFGIATATEEGLSITFDEAYYSLPPFSGGGFASLWGPINATTGTCTMTFKIYGNGDYERDTTAGTCTDQARTAITKWDEVGDEFVPLWGIGEYLSGTKMTVDDVSMKNY